MGFKCQGFRGVDDDLGSSIFVGYVDCTGAVIVVKPRIGPDQLAALLSLLVLSLPSPPVALTSENYGESEGKSSEDSSDS